MHELKCQDCQKHLGFADIHNCTFYEYCDGCALIKGEEAARKFIPIIYIDESTNAKSSL